MRKFEDRVKEIPITGRNGIIKLGAQMSGKSLGLKTLSLRYGLIDSVGMLPEDTDKLHVHDYDEVIWLLGGDPKNMTELGARVEVDMGTECVRSIVAVPKAIVIPKGTPHFSPIVTEIDRPFYFFTVCITDDFKAEVADEELKPMSGEWMKFRGEYFNCFKQLSFDLHDPYHYGSEFSQFSGGYATFMDNHALGVPLTMNWMSICLPHTMGPRRDDNKHHPHVHDDFEEALIFFSMDEDNLTDLHGEVDYCMGAEDDVQEHYILTKATVMAMSKGTYHLPLSFPKADKDKPYIFVTLGQHEI